MEKLKLIPQTKLNNRIEEPITVQYVDADSI